MNISDKIALWLVENGFTHAFGIVGGGNVALWNAIARAKRTELISCHHEQAAAMAAAYYFRTRGRMALCLVTTGAGSANPLTGVVAAWMDSVPLLVVSGNEASKYLNTTMRVMGTQGFDTIDLVKPITKFSARASSESAVPMLAVAREIALRPRRGPVWIDIPKDVQNAKVG